MRNFLTILILLMSLTLRPALADDTRGTNDRCTQLGTLTGIIDLTDALLNPQSQGLNIDTSDLKLKMAAFNPLDLRQRLTDAGRADRFLEAQLYIAELKKFLNVADVHGALYGGWIINNATFKTRHARLYDLSKAMCTTTRATSETATSLSPLKQLQLSPIQRGKALKSYTIHKEAMLLMQVFFLLALTMALLFTINHLLKLFRAIRLDRYSCAIPATAIVGDTEILGHINVIGLRGLSFEVRGPLSPIHFDTLTLDRKVRFKTETFAIQGILTKAFDGSAGFRLLVPLQKPKLHKILALSTVTPRRKIEMGRRKKKPATPSRASLAG